MTPLKLYNTLGRQLEEFKPLNETLVGLYTCGPTVYGTAHLGNLRTYIFEDILHRTLELNGYAIKHVMNVTDVGHLTGDGDMGQDKMELAAKSEKKSALEIAREHEQEFFRDLHKLNIDWPADGDKNFKVLRATETIDLQVDLIAQLEKKGFTYVTSDGVYFDTSKFPRYGELSGQKASDKKSGARVEVNAEKRNPSDFALWKFSKPTDQRQMEWPSPWGTGFPGWHLECSAMSMHELGEQFDIHTGGVDHIAVHHENEIAQSEAATGKHPFVNFWLHGEFMILPDKRMGKSEGNAITLDEAIEHKVHPLAFRYLCLQSHYRSPLSFTWEALEAANVGLHRIWYAVADLGDDDRQVSPATKEWAAVFQRAINADLNTAEGLAVVQQVVKSDELSNGEKREILEHIDQVLGLDLNPADANTQVTPSFSGLESMLEDYEVARREKRYTISDQIRKKLDDMGIMVEDLDDGSSRLRKK